MTDKDNRKRYVYLDKFFEYQEKVNRKLENVNARMNLLMFVTTGLIFAMTYALYKIFE